MNGLIDVEAHFLTEEYVKYLRERTELPRQEVEGDQRRTWFEPSCEEITITSSQFLEDNLLDLGEQRIALMDEQGIQAQALSLTTPGVEQFEPEASLEHARLSNDVLAEALRRYPDRFIGLATLGPALPEESAEEVRRCVNELGFRGVNIMSHVGAEYLDDRRFWPIFEAAEELGVPVNLHPTIPHGSMLKPYLGYGWALPGPGLGFGHETAVHAMRLIYSGLFDKHPNLQLILGHFGEALPFWMYRIDFDFTKSWLSAAHRPQIERKPSDYLKQNVWYTSSGNFLNAALATCMLEVGADRIMFASDYPWERFEDAVEFLEQAPLADADRAKIASENARRLFNLEPAEAGSVATAAS